MNRLKYKVRNEGNRGIDAYVHNIIEFSKTFEEHIRCLESLFRVADETCLSFRADNCEFAKQELQFLGIHYQWSDRTPHTRQCGQSEGISCPQYKTSAPVIPGIMQL